MSETPKFSFGPTPTTSEAPGSSLFGSANTSTGPSLFNSGNTSAIPFGSGTTSTSGGTGFSFASFGIAPSSTGDQNKALFGTADNKPKDAMFGTGPSTFASKPDENKTIGTSTFSGFGAPQQTPAKSGSFGVQPSGASQAGSTTPAPASTAFSSFGGNSTTPAGPPPVSVGFNASTGTGAGAGLFNLNVSKPAQEGQSGNAGNTNQTSQPFNLSPNPAEQSQQNNITSSFGSKPAEQAQPNNTSSSSLFGSKLVGSATSAQKSFFNFPPSTSSPAISAPTASPFGAPPASTQPAGTSMFAKPTSSADSTASKPSFAFPQTKASSAPSSATPATEGGAQKSFFSGLGLNATSQASSEPQTSSGSWFTSTAAPSSSIGSSDPSAAASSAPTTSAPLFSLKTSTTTSTSQPSASTAPATAGPTPLATSAAGGSALGASTSGPVPPSQSRLRNKTMDEILTRWASDLTKYTKQFKSHAEVVAHWDQILVDNMAKITKLYSQTATSEKQTASVELQLTHVESQQSELDAWLAKYEAEVEEMSARNGQNQSELGGPDQERERTYKLAEKLEERLEDMTADLESMIEEVNNANASLTKHTKADEPITQIVRILNSHLTQLQTIDQGTAALQAKLAVAQKNAQSMNYVNGGSVGPGGSAVDEFYRSYMGRR